MLLYYHRRWIRFVDIFFTPKAWVEEMKKKDKKSHNSRLVCR